MVARFNWLHLTDLHFGQQDQGPLWPNVRDRFFEDLARIHDRCGPWHTVLFTGDLVYSGQRDQFERLEAEVLGRLWDKLKELGSPDAVLLAVPGNHDLARPKQLAAAIRQLIEPQSFDSIADEFWSQPTGEYRQAVTEALNEYSQWWAKTRFRPRSIRDGLLPGDFGCTLEVGGRRIGIIGLNTTFLQLVGGDFEGKLAWHPRQMHQICEDAPDWVAQHDVCLLLTHQPDTWLSARAKEAYSEINPAGRFAAHLSGHMHETKLLDFRQAGGPGVRRWQSTSLFGMERFADPKGGNTLTKREHGYMTGRIEFDEDQITMRCWPRTASKDENGWRCFAHHRRGVLIDDEGTTPEEVKKKAANHP